MKELIDFKEKIDKDKLEEVCKSIKDGSVIVFPTETVYGIGANALDKSAVKKIFMAKNRPTDNPLIVHISNYDMLDKVVSNVTKYEKILMDKFWPGPLTIILPKKEEIPNIVTCNLDTVGVRMPSNKIAINIIEKSGVPIAAPSANISGKPSGTLVTDIVDELKDSVDYIIDGGISDIGLESTVVKLENDVVNILRPGAITKEDILSTGLNVVLDKHLFKDVQENEKVASPGMKHRHYAPKVKTILVYSNDEKKEYDRICDIINENNNKKIGILGFNENKEKYINKPNVKFMCIGSKHDLNSVAKNVFTVLRKLDKYDLDLSIIEGVEKQGIGLAIMNRLTRACGYNVIEL